LFFAKCEDGDVVTLKRAARAVDRGAHGTAPPPPDRPTFESPETIEGPKAEEVLSNPLKRGWGILTEGPESGSSRHRQRGKFGDYGKG
jgi:hypothetical protein